MALIEDRKKWKVNNQASRLNSGPLLRVTRPDGSTVKMYEADAVAAGYLPGKAKQAPPPENKIAPLAADKAAPATPPEDFTVIPGVGKASARSLVAQGVTSLNQLRGADLSALTLSKAVVAAIEEWRG